MRGCPPRAGQLGAGWCGPRFRLCPMPAVWPQAGHPEPPPPALQHGVIAGPSLQGCCRIDSNGGQGTWLSALLTRRFWMVSRAPGGRGRAGGKAFVGVHHPVIVQTGGQGPGPLPEGGATLDVPSAVGRTVRGLCKRPQGPWPRPPESLVHAGHVAPTVFLPCLEHDAKSSLQREVDKSHGSRRARGPGAAGLTLRPLGGPGATLSTGCR